MAAPKNKKKLDDTRFLSLLEKILPKTTPDHKLAHEIYDQVEREIRIEAKLAAFEAFCEKDSLADMDPETLANLKADLSESFGEENVIVNPDPEEKTIGVNITLPDRLFSGTIKIEEQVEEDEEPKAPFVPFPVCLPTDPELVWMLSRRENFGPDECDRALDMIQEEFWGTKAGQKLLKSGCERTFADFITYVPASKLAESGLKRHYKTPETLKTLHGKPQTEPKTAEKTEAPKKEVSVVVPNNSENQESSHPVEATSLE